MERGLEGGQRPHNRPLSPARRAQGESHEKKERKRENAGCSRKEQGSGESPTPVEVGGERLGFSALFQSFCSYPLRPPGGASEGPVGGNLRFPPRGPSLQPPPESPFPFRVERLPVRPASSCSNKSFAFGTLGLVGTGSHGGARPGPTSYRHPSRRTTRPGARFFSGRARPPAIPPAAGRGTHKG